MVKNIKVCHLLLGAADELAGVQKYVAMLADRNMLVVINDSKIFSSYLKKRKIKFALFENSKQLNFLLKEKRINILHCHLGSALKEGVQQKKLLDGLKLIFTQHFIQPAYVNSLFFAIKRIVYREWLSKCDVVIAISKAVKDAMLARNEVEKDKVKLVYNGVRFPARIKPNVYGKRKEKVLTVCRLEKEKNPKIIIKIAAMLSDVDFVLVGSGQLEMYIREKAPSNLNVVGYVENVADYYCSSDLFVFPSSIDAFGLSMIEAQSFGLPVIAPRAGAAREIINNKNGVLVSNYDDIDGFCKAIKKVLFDKMLYKKLSKGALQNAKKYSAQNFKENINKLYQKVAR